MIFKSNLGLQLSPLMKNTKKIYKGDEIVTSREENKMTKKIMIWSVKGGSGKTTTALTLSRELVKDGYKVLVEDFDPQANLSKSLCNERFGKTMADLFSANLSTSNIDEAVYHLDVNLDLIPASLTLVNSEMSVRSNPICDQARIIKKLNQTLENRYDVIIMDFNPYPSLLTTNGLIGADVVYIPTTCDEWSLNGVITTLMQIQQVEANFDKKIPFKVLFNMVNRNNSDKAQREAIMKQLNEKQYFKNYINFQGKPFVDKSKCVTDYANGNTTVGQQWNSVIAEVLEDLESEVFGCGKI